MNATAAGRHPAHGRTVVTNTRPRPGRRGQPVEAGNQDHRRGMLSNCGPREAEASSARSDGTDADLRTEEKASSAPSDGTDADLRTEEKASSAPSDGTDADLRTE